MSDMPPLSEAPIFWALLAFLSGALPFSVWIGRLALQKDIRTFGDGNPGAFNVFRAGSRFWGWLAILLDFLKGAIPVSLAQFSAGIDGWWLVLIALAPVFGHAYSPLLKFRGGKALAVTFGIWAGLTLWPGPIILGSAFSIFLLILRDERWTVFAGQAALLTVFFLMRADWTWFAVWLGSSLIFLIKYRKPTVSVP